LANIDPTCCCTVQGLIASPLTDEKFYTVYKN